MREGKGRICEADATRAGRARDLTKGIAGSLSSIDALEFVPRGDDVCTCVLVHNALAIVRLRVVDVRAVACGIDERRQRILCVDARDELTVPAPRSRTRGHPDVDWKVPQHTEAAFEIGALFWISHALHHGQRADADDVQQTIAVTNGKRPRRAATRDAACDVCGERDRPDADGVAVLQSMIDARG